MILDRCLHEINRNVNSFVLSFRKIYPLTEGGRLTHQNDLKANAPIEAWEVKLEIMTDRPTDQQTNRQTDRPTGS